MALARSGAIRFHTAVRHRPFFALGAATLLAVGCASLVGARPLRPGQRAPGDTFRSIDIGGRTRTYFLHVPAGLAPGARPPLLLVLHGSGQSANDIINQSRMNEAADRHGFLVAYPNGTSWLRYFLLSWNSGRCCGDAHAYGSDDVGFLRALVELIPVALHGDTARVYAAGFSDGGRMAYRLGCELSEKVAAIAVLSGAMPDTTCRPARAVSLIAVHGTADKRLPYATGATRQQIRRGSYHLSIPGNVAFWAARDRCSTSPLRDSTGATTRDAYPGCPGGRDVVLYTLIGWGHAWPETLPVWDDEARIPRQAQANDVLLDFLAAHPKVSAPPTTQGNPPG
ncbi:MAG: PHB depolymerase family esterase [Gemmatimonadaceae bacterium]